MPNKDIILLDGDDDGSSAGISEKVNILSEKNCKIENYCDGPDCFNILSDFAFERLFACGSSSRSWTSISRECQYLDCENQIWVEFESLPSAITLSSATIIKENGKEISWWITGGQNEQGRITLQHYQQVYLISHSYHFLPPGNVTTKTWMLSPYLNWMKGPNLRQPRQGHCTVQLDDCRVAVIGGWTSSAFATPIPALPVIDIYNAKTGVWHDGPELPGPLIFSACSKVLDLKTFQPVVVIGCAMPDTSRDVFVWDLTDNSVKESGFKCPPSSSMILKKNSGCQTYNFLK